MPNMTFFATLDSCACRYEGDLSRWADGAFSVHWWRVIIIADARLSLHVVSRADWAAGGCRIWSNKVFSSCAVIFTHEEIRLCIKSWLFSIFTEATIRLGSILVVVEPEQVSLAAFNSSKLVKVSFFVKSTLTTGSVTRLFSGGTLALVQVIIPN